MANALDVTNDNFEQEVLKSETPVLVDFWAPWCVPCRRIAPHVDALAGDLAGRLKVTKVNTDEAPEIASKYGIMGIPTLLLFKNGQVVEQLGGGTLNKQSIQSRVEPHLG